MSTDLPLDETALQAAGQKVCKQILWLQDAEGEQRAKELARTAISTYLREAGFRTEDKQGTVATYRRQATGWERVPVQVENKEQLWQWV